MGSSSSKNLNSKILKELSKQADVPYELVQEQYEKYEKYSSWMENDEIPRRKFMKYFAQYAKDDELFVNQLYDVFDLDHNGTLSFPEFLVGMAMIDSKNDRLNLRIAFALFDFNKNGRIEKSEIEKSYYFLSKFGCKDEKSREEFANQMIIQLDLNEDGSIELNEFIEGVIKNASKYREQFLLK